MAKSANAVNWFEIPVNDLDKAKSFYEAILGIELQPSEMGPMKMAWFPMTPEGTGATGTLVKSAGYTPSHSGSLVYLSVDDLEATLGKIDANGGKTLMPKQSIGEFGWIAHFEDCEGNRVALHQEA